MIVEDGDKWLPEFGTAMQALGHAMQGRALTPKLLASLAPAYENVIADHTVKVAHLRRTRATRRMARYEIAIVGNRLNAMWYLTTAQLRDVLNTACLSYKIRSS